MKNNQQATKFAVLIATFISVQIVMTVIPFLGFIPIFAINITTLHLPTLLAGMLLGVKGGAIIGLTFGMMSVMNATIRPGLVSFVFSPFAPAPAGFNGNPLSLLVAIVPRILLGVFAALIYQFAKKKRWQRFASTSAAVIATVLHTWMVLSLIFMIFAHPYAVALDLDGPRGVLAFLGLIVVQNSIFEAILAGVLMTVFVTALEPIVKKMVNQ